MKESPARFYASAAVHELERRAIAAGDSGYALMQRAAAAAFAQLAWHWPRAQRIGVLCGPGNNGGDGYELARLARAAGCDAQLWQVGKPGEREESVQARKAWRVTGGAVTEYRAQTLEGFDVLVDGIFGTGLARAPGGAAQAAIAAINAGRSAGAGVLALDVPSGLDADRGSAPGEVVTADVTASFIAAKAGLYTGFGPDHAGQVVLDDLHAPPATYDGVPVLAGALDASTLKAALPRRARSAHKGDHGHVLLIGGDEGMGGALLLAARAAQRAGAGLLSLVTRKAYAAAITAAQPELMCHGLEEPRQLRGLLDRAGVIALGPGLGRGEWGREIFAHALSARQPMVIDADGLNWLAENPAHRANWVLTPHPGEAARLLGCSTIEIQNDRFKAAHDLREKFGGVVVLKGAGTLVQGAATGLCAHGNPGMAVGGMGDVLCGLIAGLIAQGLAPEDAAQAGVAAHALAGDAAVRRRGERGLTPSDLIEGLRAQLNP